MLTAVEKQQQQQHTQHPLVNHHHHHRCILSHHIPSPRIPLPSRVQLSHLTCIASHRIPPPPASSLHRRYNAQTHNGYPNPASDKRGTKKNTHARTHRGTSPARTAAADRHNPSITYGIMRYCHSTVQYLLTHSLVRNVCDVPLPSPRLRERGGEGTSRHRPHRMHRAGAGTETRSVVCGYVGGLYCVRFGFRGVVRR